ncbi:IS66 family transposase [Massilia sp.]|uniref:IS66 family transposase n=1 Tax=Massilia sp. TaxID=1882437 RepID=UPI00391B9298
MTGELESVDLAALPGAVRELLIAQQGALEAARAECDAVLADRDALRARQADLQEDNAELRALNARLEHLVREFQQALYGRKAERFDPDQRELLFEDLETAVVEAETAVETRPSRSRPKAPRRNLGRLPAELPRIEQVIEPESRACPCGCGEMEKIGEDRSERLDVVPAQFRVIATIRPRYACKTCGQGIVQARAPAHLVEGGLPTEGLVAHVLVGKYCDHTPLYRQVGIFGRSGIALDRSTLAGWTGRAAFHLAPVVDRLAAHLKASGKLFMDETRLPVLDPGRGRTKTGYLWALARDDRAWGGTDPPGVVYFYADGRGGCHAEEILEGFRGILQVDGYAGYNRLTAPGRDGGALQLAYCWAHARRKLKEAFDASGSPIAGEGLARIAALYEIETEIRGQPAAQRLAVRQTRSAPLVEAFGTWLRKKRGRVSARSRLGEKLAYIANHWDGLRLFLADGRIEIDSNAVENRIRPVALTRKNALFAGHDEGGRTWGRIASLIETARLNGVEPQAYLKATLEAIAAGHPKARIDELLPWAFKSSH